MPPLCTAPRSNQGGRSSLQRVAGKVLLKSKYLSAGNRQRSVKSMLGCQSPARGGFRKGAGKSARSLGRRGSVEPRGERDFAAPEMIDLSLMAGRDCAYASNFGVPPDV